MFPFASATSPSHAVHPQPDVSPILALRRCIASTAARRCCSASPPPTSVPRGRAACARGAPAPPPKPQAPPTTSANPPSSVNLQGFPLAVPPGLRRRLRQHRRNRAQGRGAIQERRSISHRLAGRRLPVQEEVSRLKPSHIAVRRDPRPALPRAKLGRRERAQLFMLHGWMDVGASFQFLVDALAA